MNNWKELKKQDLQSEIVSCMESLRPAIYQIVTNSIDETYQYDFHDFDYYVDCCVDHYIILMWDGWEFAAADTDQFNGAGDFIAWVIEALNIYYMEDPEEQENE